VPGDPSAGAFFAAAAAALPGSRLVLEDVSLNQTRLGFYRALERMGARVDRVLTRRWCGEPVGRITIRSASKLHAIRIDRRQVPALIDEVPALAVVAAASARGRTTISGAAELRVKESDRISALVDGLRAVGFEAEERPDGLLVRGDPDHVPSGEVRTRGDHRIAMAFGALGAVPGSDVRVDDPSVVSVSYPEFWIDLERVASA
jgi:3-phosphoshikimate 1-carboxyvinyltransferase